MRTGKNRVSNRVSNSVPCLSVLDAEELINVGMRHIVYGPGAGHARSPGATPARRPREHDMNHREPTTDADLEKRQHQSFHYFLYAANTANALVIDKTALDWPASIAAIGLALAAYPVGVERGYVSRADAAVSYTHLRAHETDSYLVCRL